MDGLIIKKEPLELIFRRTKTFEIRNHVTKKRGRIALIESGTGLIVGEAKIVNSFKFFSNCN